MSLLVFVFCEATHAGANQNTLPTEEQAHKLAAAAWQERAHSIDLTLYVEITWPPKPAEQIRQEVEEFFEKEIAALGENPPPVLLQRTKESIELNIRRRMEAQRFPRLIKKRIRISGHNHRVDQVIAEPGKQLKPNTPFDSTYVNVGPRDSADFFSFHYYHKVQHATIQDKSGWGLTDPPRFALLPAGVSSSLRASLGVNEGTDTKPAFIPDPNKIQQFTRTGILTVSTEELSVNIAPHPSTPDAKDRIAIRYPKLASGGTILICDRNDYSRVHHLEFSVPGSNSPLYVRECSNFDSEGFPRDITEIQYGKDGNLKEKSVYTILQVHLNPSIPDEVFEFRPPEGYKVMDLRSKKPQASEPN